MTALDTNVLVRFLVRDDAHQAERVYRRLKQAEAERERLRIPLLVLLETIWVLDSAYGRARGDIIAALEDVRRMPVFELEAADVVERTLAEARASRGDLADLLIRCSAQAGGSAEVLTFDQRAARLPGFRLLT